jgi:HK97 family phage major capsid protein|tara:strand:+ start:5025 stop:6341 length:1317 start_codon:yes stop_codon:yes gene_type:complete
MAVATKGKTTKELREERANIAANARTYLEEHEEEWAEEHDAVYDEMIADTSTLKAAIERRDALVNVEPPEQPDQPEQRAAGFEMEPGERPNERERPAAKRMIKVRDGFGYIERPVGARGTTDYQLAFDRALSSGVRGLTPEQHAALQSDNDPQAGYLVASEEFAAGLLKDVDDLLFVRRFANIHTVREATSLGIRKRTAKASTFGWTSELELSTADTTLAYGKKVLTPHHLTGAIKVSRDLLRRTMGSVAGVVQGEMALDAGETMEDAYFTGDGSQSPLGVFTASADGISTGRDVSTGNTTTAIGADGLREAKYTLKSQYRNMGPRWLFHRDGIKQVSKLKDGDGQYLWRNGITEGDPDMLLGYPVDESERSPNTFTTGLYVGLLGVWRYYEIADALNMEVQVLTELYAETNQVGYIGRLKTDGMPTLEEAFVRVTLA